jgi:hypothetical protein
VVRDRASGSLDTDVSAILDQEDAVSLGQRVANLSGQSEDRGLVRGAVADDLLQQIGVDLTHLLHGGTLAGRLRGLAPRILDR